MKKVEIIAALEANRDGLWKTLGCLEAIIERSDDAPNSALLHAAKTVCGMHLELADDAIHAATHDDGDEGEAP